MKQEERTSASRERFGKEMDDDHGSDELEFLRSEVKRLRERLAGLTPSLPLLLKRRGFAVYKKEPVDDLLIPAPQFLETFYTHLHKYSFRLLLRDIIKHQDLRFTLEQVTRYSTTRVIRSYLHYLREVRLVAEGAAGYLLSREPVTSFGPTLEWYVAELLKREFGAEALWGVKFRRPRVGGDYDVLAKLDGSLLYIETKSSPPKQVVESEIAAFLDRAADLAPELSIFLMDTELRMKDKIVPMFEQELAKRQLSPPVVARIERELFRAGDSIYIVNAKESIGRNIETLLSQVMRGR